MDSSQGMTDAALVRTRRSQPLFAMLAIMGLGVISIDAQDATSRPVIVDPAGVNPAQDPAPVDQPQDSRASPGDLTTLGLEDLMDIEVSSVSKHREKLLDAPAAVYVITNEDLRRSGRGDSATASRTRCSC